MQDREGMQFFRMCRDALDSKIDARARDLPSWSSKGFSNFFMRIIAVAIIS